MVRSLEAHGLRTVGDIARTEPRALADRFGSHGLRLAQLAQGQDARAVDPDSERKSVSAETTFEEDYADQQTLEDRLWPLCEKVARICRRDGIAGRVAVLKLRKADFSIITRRRTLPAATQTARVLFQVGRELLAREIDGTAYRLIGIGAAELIEAGAAEGDLFVGDETKALKSERAMDALRDRFGSAAVLTGRAL